jgi:quercetin dioxygenase-like cupin family protein
MQFLVPGEKFSPRNEPYTCETLYAENEEVQIPSGDTAYGYVISGTANFNDQAVKEGQFFCWTSQTEDPVTLSGEYLAWVVIRRGFKGQNVIGSDIEKRGRLVYIDGCSDSLLVYPPRLGDSSLNLLSFPESINQSFHTHPSARYGLVISGEGWAEQTIPGQSETVVTKLEEGVVFYLPTLERHRFRTEDSEMRVLAFHPDGDWGPTDHDHTMLNRTYLK